MKKKWMAALFGSMLVLGACGGEETTETAESPDDSASEQTQADPEQLVTQNCISCHGENLEGRGNFPPLNNVGSRMSEEEILDVIINGQGAMPPEIITGEDAEVVAEYLSNME